MLQAQSDRYYNYARLLEGAGPRLKEIILDRAAHDYGITLEELAALCHLAYPEEV